MKRLWAGFMLVVFGLALLAVSDTRCNATFAGTLRAHVNTPHYASESYAGSFSPGDLVTDYAVVLGEKVEYPPATYAQTLATLTRAKANVGAYLSSALVRDLKDMRSYPAECLSPKLFTDSDYAAQKLQPTDEPGRRLDIANPVTRAKLVKATVDEAVARGRGILFSDNWAHPAHWVGYVPWATSIAYMRDLRTELNARGVKLFVNVALAPGLVSGEDVWQLSQSADGVALEMALLPEVAKDPDKLAAAVTQYKMLAGLTVVLIPIGGDDEAKFLAGFAMMFDGPLVAYPFWKPAPEWQGWRDKLGEPLGDAEQVGTVLGRRFQRGKVIVDCAGRTVAVN